MLPAAAYPASPELHFIMPTGAQRGTSAQFTFGGARLEDAQAVLFYRPGITVRQVKAESPTAIRVECDIAPDCPLGEHPARLRTATGVTELRTVFIGALPVLIEAEPNGSFDAPQAVPINTTIAGTIGNEDVDYFAVEAKAGDRITAEVEAMRLGRGLFDAAVAILDARRFELAASDDSALLAQDPVASVVAPADGKYVVAVREASFGGGDNCHYRLHVGTFPRPAALFPPGARAGETMPLFLLSNSGVPGRMELTTPNEWVERWPVFAEDDRGAAPSPNWLRVNDLPHITEPQVFDSAASTQPAARPAAPEPPVAFNGMLDAPGQSDAWRFRAAAGRALSVEVFARRLRSPLDAFLEVVDGSGRVLAANDDGAGMDSALRFQPPADGEFAVRLRDHRGRGGPTFVYRIEITPPRQSVELTLERRDNTRPQFLQAVAVPRGNRMAALLRVDRKGAAGPAVVEALSLPAGVTMTAAPVAADQSAAPIVFEAAADAPLDGGLHALRVRVVQEGGDVAGMFHQNIPLVFGPPNDSLYYQTRVDRMAVAVADAAPFKVTITPPPGGILRNGAGAIGVAVERAEGFSGDIDVTMLWNPPGVSSAGSIRIAREQSSGGFPINAAGDAPTGVYPVAVLAWSAVGGGDRWVSSGFADLPVGDVFLDGKLELGAIERGKSGAVLCRLTHRRPFEGVARISLVGLPVKTAARVVEIAPGQAEAVFEVVVESDAPVGQHGGLYCEAQVDVGGHPLSHRFAMNGAIRIDPPPAPPAAPANAPPPPPPPPPPSPSPPRPLSRLEQLRREAAERAATSRPSAPQKQPGGGT